MICRNTADFIKDHSERDNGHDCFCLQVIDAHVTGHSFSLRARKTILSRLDVIHPFNSHRSKFYQVYFYLFPSPTLPHTHLFHDSTYFL